MVRVRSIRVRLLGVGSVRVILVSVTILRVRVSVIVNVIMRSKSGSKGRSETVKSMVRASAL